MTEREIAGILRGGRHAQELVRLGGIAVMRWVGGSLLPKLEEHEPDPAIRWRKLRALFGRR